jgi:hypothetical protein
MYSNIIINPGDGEDDGDDDSGDFWLLAVLYCRYGQGHMRFNVVHVMDSEW